MKLNFYVGSAIMALFLSLGSLTLKAQQTYFEPVSTAQLRLSADANPHIRKLAYYRLRETDLRTYLAKAPVEFTNRGPAIALQIPLPDGTIETFDMLESPMLAPAIAAKHPEIKTYNGQGQTHRNYTIRISFTALGFNAIILGVNGDAVYYEKASTNQTDQVYRSYFARDAERPTPANTSGKSLNTKCGTDESGALPIKTQPANNGARSGATQNQVSTGIVLRTFRLAVAANGEFTQLPAYGGNVNAAFAGLVGYVNRMNAVFGVELSVRFTLVTDVTAVYSNTATDPYTNSSQSTMLAENQANLDKLVGNANYDVGHVLGFEGGSGGGLASLGVLCDNLYKAQGVTGIGDGSFAAVFDDQTLTHEMGHQFGMTHSYNSTIPVCTSRNPATSVEPGSGATIMSYGFTCYGSDGNGGDDYEKPAYGPILTFHTVNYDQAQALITNTATCYTTTNLNNSAPVLVVPASRTVPKSTPFTLTGTASDANNDPLTYSWEGTDIATIVPTQTTLGNTAQPPFFRTYQPIATGTRTFPRLDAILSGTNQAKGDKLPSVGIVTHHRLTVRDGKGGLAYDQMTVTIAANSGPFLETTNLTGTYLQNTAKTITWSVANTTAAPVSCATVNILLSTDGGLTFPTTLVANTPNDGSEAVTLPAIETDKARIKIASSNNIFFDISNANFSIINPASQKPLVVTLKADKTTTSLAGPVVLTAMVSGGRAAYTYSFEGNLGYSDAPFNNTNTLTSLQAGVHSFTVTVTDNSFPASQTATAIVSFTAQSVPLVGLNAPDSVATKGTGGNNGGKIARKQSGSAPVEGLGNNGDDYAIFHFARSNGDGPLTVRYSISGSAIGNSVPTFDDNETFEDGETDFDLYVYPGTDLLQNGDETLTLTLIDESDYDVLPQDEDATILIEDNDGTTQPTGPATLTITSINCFSTNGALSSVNFVVGYSDGTFAPALPLLFMNGVTASGQLGQSYTLNFDANSAALPIQDNASRTTYFVWDYRAACTGPVSGTVAQPTGPTTLTITNVNCVSTKGALSSVDFVVGYSDGTFAPALPLLFMNGVTASGQLGQSYTLNFDANSAALPIQDNASRSTYFVWDYRAACANRSTRISAESTQPWQLQVQGNPVHSELTVRIIGAQAQSLQLALTDAAGRVITTRQIVPVSGQHTEVLDVSGQSAGLFLVRVVGDTQSQTLKVLKK